MRTVALLLALLFFPLAGRASALAVGDRAPDFTLPDPAGKPVHLAAFRGKSNVVLAFYVMAFTPG
jgi:thioredoxin-dependent peroxiredoxin